MNRVISKISQLPAGWRPRYVVYYQKTSTGSFAPFDMVNNGRSVNQLDRHVMKKKGLKKRNEEFNESLDVRNFVHKYSTAQGHMFGTHTTGGRWYVDGLHVVERTLDNEYGMEAGGLKRQLENEDEVADEFKVKSSWLKGKLLPGNKDIDSTKNPDMMNYVKKTGSEARSHLAKVVGKFRSVTN